MRRDLALDWRKPTHLALAGVILAGVAGPAVVYFMTNARYYIPTANAAVIARPSQQFASKLAYDNTKQAYVFNKDGEAKAQASAKDKLAMGTGAGGAKDNQLYTASMPQDASKGVTIHDNVNDISITFKPQVKLLDGRDAKGRVIYPLGSQDGQLIFTPKGNGVKEDILLSQSPGDVAKFSYEIDVPDSVKMQLDDDGSVGFYTGDPQLFGNISYGSQKDEDMVNQARKNALKSYLMFKIPAPVIKQSKPTAGPTARFGVDGNVLTTYVRGLDKASYPLSIDPTFLLTSTADFGVGAGDDNIDLATAGQVGRAAMGGGSTAGWATAAGANQGLTAHCGNYSSGAVAYNGNMYSIGGGNDGCASGTTPNDITSARVYYISLDPITGALGAAWTDTSSLNTARQGLLAFGFNGYLYAVGGEDDTGNPITAANSVEFAKINSDGSVGTWNYTGHLTTGRSYMAGASYSGVLYAMGGATGLLNANPVTTTEYARINGDGTIGTCGTGTFNSGCTWSSGTALTSARNRFSGAAYNGFVYVAGGRTSTPGVLNTVEYAPIQADGSLGSWITGNAFPTARRDHGMGMERGHMYIYGGCSVATISCTSFLGDTQYAVINADGSLGEWQQTDDYTAGNPSRDMPSSMIYNGYLYFLGGCTVENGGNDCNTATPGIRTGVFYTQFDPPGRFDNGMSGHAGYPYETSNATPRMGNQSVVLNGYLYDIGGCSTANSATCGTVYSSLVEYAPIAANGTLGSWTTNTNSLVGIGTNKAGRIGMSLVGYNNKIYVIGGVEFTSANADSYRADVLSATQTASTGALGTFSAETNAMPTSLAFSTAVVWHNYVYVLGGTDGTNASTAIYRSQITGGTTLGAWATAKQADGTTVRTLGNARWGHSGGIWGNWIYVVGGQSNMTSGYVATTAATEQLTVDNNGNISAISTLNLTGAFAARGMGGVIHNGFMYMIGGYNTGSTTQVATIRWTKLDPTSGNPVTPNSGNVWQTTGIGSATTGTYAKTDGQISTARGLTAAAEAGGYIYISGGCAGTLAAGTFKQCVSTFVTAATHTELYEPNNGGIGQVTPFVTGSGNNVVDLPISLADHASVAYNGRLYIVGGCTVYTAGACTTNSGNVYSHAISPGGFLTGTWTTETSLPLGRSLLQAAAYNGFLYVLGGRTDATGAVATVTYTTISSTGTLGGSWTNADLPSGAERRAFGAAISAGYIYAVGGEGATGTKKNDVYYAQVNADGSLGSWATTSSFTTARASFSLGAYNGVLYIIGGTDGTNNLLDVQYGAISGTGTIASWLNSTDVARGMVGRQAVAANGYMYFLGNEGSTSKAAFVPIHANGTLGLMQDSANSMTGAHPHGSAVMSNGIIYDSGGCVLSGASCTTVNAGIDKGGQSATSRTGHYSKLFNTQVDTSPTQLVINGATNGPGSVVEFKFQTASQSDPVLGVAQLIRPVVFGNFYNVQALNSAGTNVGVAFNYFYAITLDDSRSGTFPDVAQSGYSQTAVTDITLYYHANPSRRLRHGASFTNTDCNSTPANGCILDTAP